MRTSKARSRRSTGRRRPSNCGLDGKVRNANDNFLKAFGYTLAELRGQDRGIFIDAADRQTAEYHRVWDSLFRGEFHAGQYKRLGKGGREIWIQASYNPVFDLNGKPLKIVEYATDITSQKQGEIQLKLAVQQTQEVIEAAQSNDLARRISTEGKSGELEKLCAGVNGLLDTMTRHRRRHSGIVFHDRVSSVRDCDWS